MHYKTLFYFRGTNKPSLRKWQNSTEESDTGGTSNKISKSFSLLKDSSLHSTHFLPVSADQYTILEKQKYKYPPVYYSEQDSVGVFTKVKH